MVPDYHITFVEKSQIDQILGIYRPYILNTASSFETVVPSIAEFEKRVMDYAAKAPWLVAQTAGKVLGYAYATAHRSRGAYQWSQEVTVYVHPDHQKQGIGRKLYTMLLTMLQHLGYSRALGIITLPNYPSIRLHEDLGFEHIGDMPDIGFKFDEWHTTSWWQKQLQPSGFKPKAILQVEAAAHLLDF